jgi:ATP-dependent protease ClpP protease subunit
MFHLLYAALVLFPNPSYFLSRRNILQSGIVMSSLLDTKTIKNGDDDDVGFIRGFNNNLYYSGPITDSAIFSITSNLITMQNEANFDHINLHMQSPGGSLLPSLGLVDLIRTSDVPINTYVDGYCASAA